VQNKAFAPGKPEPLAAGRRFAPGPWRPLRRVKTGKAALRLYSALLFYSSSSSAENSDEFYL